MRSGACAARPTPPLAPAVEDDPLEGLIPAPVRETAERSPRSGPQAACVLHDPAPPTAPAADTAAIISLAPPPETARSIEGGPAEPLAEPDPQRLECAMRDLKDEVAALLEILS